MGGFCSPFLDRVRSTTHTFGPVASRAGSSEEGAGLPPGLPGPVLAALEGRLDGGAARRGGAARPSWSGDGWRLGGRKPTGIGPPPQNGVVFSFWFLFSKAPKGLNPRKMDSCLFAFWFPFSKAAEGLLGWMYPATLSTWS